MVASRILLDLKRKQGAIASRPVLLFDSSCF